MHTEVRTLEQISQTNFEKNATIQEKESNYNTLLDCPARFNGEYGAEKIDRFINYIEAYKRVKKIDDKQSLLELPHLLLDHAWTWWRGLPDEPTTWRGKLQAMRQQFSQRKPAHIIYRDIFGKSHTSAESIEKFINAKLELFSQLPRPPPAESVQLDMVYGLLPQDICNEISRNDVQNFHELIEQVKALKSTSANENETVEIKNETLKDLNDNDETLEKETNQKRVRDESLSKETNTVASTESEDREPIIKVRRTEDLMPQIKAEDAQEQEFIAEDQIVYQPLSTDDEATSSPAHLTTSNTGRDFQIDSELMSQIDNIIETCDMEPAVVAETSSASATVLEINKSPESDVGFSTGEIATIPSLMSVKISAPRILNKSARLAGIVFEKIKPISNANKPLLATSATSGPYQSPKRKRIRCNFCRGGGHTMHNCIKRSRKVLEMQISLVNQTTDSSATATVTTAPITLVAESPTVATSKFLAPTSSASESHTALTTKLISTADVPSSAKLLAAKQKNPAANSPSVKCHQCGMVGYYRSICPNCSPIYFYKPPNSVNR